jgi:hypothetical protein
LVGKHGRDECVLVGEIVVDLGSAHARLGIDLVKRLVAAPFVIISREAVVMILVRVSSPLAVIDGWVR